MSCAAAVSAAVPVAVELMAEMTTKMIRSWVSEAVDDSRVGSARQLVDRAPRSGDDFAAAVGASTAAPRSASYHVAVAVAAAVTFDYDSRPRWLLRQSAGLLESAGSCDAACHRPALG